MFAGTSLGNTKNSSHDVQQYVRRSVPLRTGCGSLPIKRIGCPQCWQRCSADPVTDVSSICFMTPRYGTRRKRQFCFFATNVCAKRQFWSQQLLCVGLWSATFWPFGTLCAFGSVTRCSLSWNLMGFWLFTTHLCF